MNFRLIGTHIALWTGVLLIGIVPAAISDSLTPVTYLIWGCSLFGFALWRMLRKPAPQRQEAAGATNPVAFREEA